MTEFLSFIKFVFGCGTVLFIVMLVLMSLPQCKLRAVGMECVKWFMTAALLLFCPMPIDAIPDVVPGVGIVDDCGYVVGAICAAKSALGDRRKRLLLEEAEFEDKLKRN